LTAFSKPYGGTGSYDRTDHPSDAFLDAELDQLKAMAQVIPPIFLFISVFLVNMIMTRLIAFEREQIGLLKAVGYANSAIAWHYTKMTIGDFAGRGRNRWHSRHPARARNGVNLWRILLIPVPGVLAGARSLCHLYADHLSQRHWQGRRRQLSGAVTIAPCSGYASASADGLSQPAQRFGQVHSGSHFRNSQ
jgi:hypothetical protein